MKLFIDEAQMKVLFTSLPLEIEDLKKATAKLVITINGSETAIELRTLGWSIRRNNNQYIVGSLCMSGRSEIHN